MEKETITSVKDNEINDGESKIWKEANEKYVVANNMIKYGGSFVKALGEALIRADNNNTKKIKNAFSEYWNEYKKNEL